MNVEKRDGKIKEFDNKKIEKAILAAAKSVKIDIPEDTLEKLVKFVVAKVSKLDEPIKIEDIQNAVEDSLMKYNLFDVERAFHDYRKERDRERFKKLSIVREMDEKLSARNVQNQNANLDEASFGGRKGEMDSAYLKEEALNYRMSPKFAKNHRDNRIYIHDLDSYSLGMHNCLSVPFDYLLAHGMRTRQVFIRPAGSANTAFQLIAVGFQLQSLQEFGGVSATHIDWTLVPYVRKSYMKHYITAYLKSTKEFEELNLTQLMFEDYKEDGIWHNRLEDWIEDRKERFLKEMNLTIKDFTLQNKTLNKSFAQSALYDTITEIKQACEGMLHNLNSLQSRSGNQLPFSSINYGTCTLEEGRLVTNAILNSTIKGVGNGMTSIFPCQIFQKMKGVNDKGSPNYDLYKLAIRSTSQRLYPNYANCGWTVNDDTKSYNYKIEDVAALSDTEKQTLINNPEALERLGLNKDLTPVKDAPYAIFSTMGCRTANGFDINWHDSWKEALNTFVKGEDVPYNFLATGQQKDGRGNICPATIILPTLAMEAKRKAEKNDHQDYVVEYFMDILERAIGDCKDELIERFNWICAQSPASARFMYENGTMYGYKPEEGIISALKHGTLAIGQLGVAESLKILIGENQTTDRGMKLAKKIEELFQTKCAEYKDHYKLNFGVYYTPAENLCYTAMNKFTKKYGLIDGVNAYHDPETDKLVARDYFTNSIHTPVWEKVDPFKKIDIESQLTGYSSAGCITYVEIGDNAKNNLESLEQIVDYAMEKDIPYFALNLPLSHCTECGSDENIGFDDNCPCCGASPDKVEHLARITGYLSTDFRHFNKGKQSEVRQRYEHVKKLTGWNQFDH